MKKLLLFLAVFMAFSFSAFSQHSSEVKTIKTGIDPATVIDYDINMDFEVKAIAAGVCFGETDPDNFFMWQINTELGNARFRPHSWTNGGGACHAEIDISSIVNVQNGTTYALRIEIRGDKASTYINNILIDADRVNPRGAGINYGYANLGFRADWAETITTNEEAYYDNIKVTTMYQGSLTTLFEENFTSTTDFLFTTGTVVDGRLLTVGRGFSWQTDPRALNYTINLNFNIKEISAGVCFGATNSGNFFMWQINTLGGRSYFRPHSWLNGGPACHEEKDIKSTIEISNNVTYALKIVVTGTKASTYINNILIDADRENPRGGKYGFAKLGFRADFDGSVYEEAYYDNIAVTSLVGGVQTTEFAENFSSPDYAFDGGDLIDGTLHLVGPGKLIFQKTPVKVYTGFKPVTTDNGFSIYPNPVKDVLTLSTNPVDYQIFNLVGKQIQTGKGSTLNVADFADGVYMVRVGNKISKFVKN